MSLDTNLKKLERYYVELKKSKKAHVDVGVIASKLSEKIYKSGVDVTQVAATHEFGTTIVPRRSFLKMPFELKKKELSGFIGEQYALIFEGKIDTKRALNLVGATARNISVEAFNTGGYGEWQPLSQETVDKKGTATILVETGTLKQSINWEVSGVSS